MAKSLSIACVQMTSSPDMDDNLKRVEILIREAAKQGASFIATPENTCQICYPAEKTLDNVYTQENHPGVKLFATLAAELNVNLLIGSVSIKGKGNKLLNRSFLFSKDGAVAATYDKIHLFDVNLGGGETYCESDIIASGENAVLCPIDDDFTLGLSICYDLRFAYLYRSLAQKGANIMCVPAAFTVPTGRAHWEVLLRARAIETGSYVIAPAQVGEHEGGRHTYGHTMIIDPWGQVITSQDEGEGIIIADLDIDQVKKVRLAIPALEHDRDYTVKG